MPTAVLVHGGLHGGWCWAKVARPLRAEGWEVHTPSLTGLGERAHLRSADVSAQMHVDDIVSLIEVEELNNVILCGHSAGGHTITGVAEAIPERIRHLVYFDAAVPEPGQTIFDVLGEDAPVPEGFRQQAAEYDGISVPPVMFSAADFGVTDTEDAAWVDRRMTPHPLRCFEEPVPVGDGFASVKHKTFVRAEKFLQPAFPRLVAKFERDPGWNTVRWDTGHDVMITMPNECIDLLKEAARA
jgi:pimeloyl-ACP methyl ester carboxylesterase